MKSLKYYYRPVKLSSSVFIKDYFAIITLPSFFIFGSNALVAVESKYVPIEKRTLKTRLNSDEGVCSKKTI